MAVARACGVGGPRIAGPPEERGHLVLDRALEDELGAETAELAQLVGTADPVDQGGEHLDAIYLPVRPDGPKEGVLVAWGFTTDGDRVLLDVCLGARERTEDWLDLGHGLIRRGLRSPLLVVTDGAPDPWNADGGPAGGQFATNGSGQSVGTRSP